MTDRVAPRRGLNCQRARTERRVGPGFPALHRQAAVPAVALAPAASLDFAPFGRAQGRRDKGAAPLGSAGKAELSWGSCRCSPDSSPWEPEKSRFLAAPSTTLPSTTLGTSRTSQRRATSGPSTRDRCSVGQAGPSTPLRSAPFDRLRASGMTRRDVRFVRISRIRLRSGQFPPCGNCGFAVQVLRPKSGSRKKSAAETAKTARTVDFLEA